MAPWLGMDEFVERMRALCARGLPSDEVQRLLAGSSIEPASLERYVRFEAGRYTRHLVFKSADVELLVLCWAQGSRAPIHGHEGERCWARVERGRLRFTAWRELSRHPLRVEPVGDAIDGGAGYVDGPADLHSVENPADWGEDAVSLHVYSKPYAECDIYDTAEGLVRRVRLQYDSVPASR